MNQFTSTIYVTIFSSLMFNNELLDQVYICTVLNDQDRDQDQDISQLMKNRPTTFELIPVYILQSNNPKGYKTFCFLKSCFKEVIYSNISRIYGQKLIS